MLDRLLSEKSKSIKSRWVELIYNTYPTDSTKFLKSDKNQFSNPVGYAITGQLVELFDALREGGDHDRIKSLLEYFIKIRAVQEFSPAQAMAFILQLKESVRQNLKDEIRDGAICEELLQFESRLDEAELLAFEIYMNCRESIFELKTRQTKNGLFKKHIRSSLPDGKGKHEEDSKDG